MTRTLLSLVLLFGLVKASAQTSSSDCEGALTLCGGIFTEINAPPDAGEVMEFTGSCNLGLETMSLWYTFTVQEEGNISFVLTPAVEADDYDWGLFNISQGGCAGIGTSTSPEVSCNSYGSFVSNGATGISTAQGGTGNSNGPGDLSGPPFNADLPVQPGEVYALVIMNWTNSPNGYSIDFTSSTADLYDATSPVIVGAISDCTNEHLYINFNEPVVTSTVQPEDFQVFLADGQTVPAVAVVAETAANANTGYTITLAEGLPTGGAYILNITSNAGNVEDICGNIVLERDFELIAFDPLTFELAVGTACNGANGTVQGTHTGGGTAPLQFAADGVPMPGGLGEGLTPGEHLIAISDAAGCEVERTVTVPDHVLLVDVPQEQASLSCARQMVTIEGVQVSPAQEVSYAWSLLVDGTATPVASGPAPTVSNEGVYVLTVTEPASGCTDQATVTIERDELAVLDLESLTFPNVISPNGDGRNDNWAPFLPEVPEMDLSGLFSEYDLNIFDRWGMLVHGTEGGGPRLWNARDAADGTYFYTISVKATCGGSIDKQTAGTITVLR
ncbi:MAG TPA: gliding motility-associated C-terminal domain-containing protein [Flavobacteriales bacterium]